MPNSIVQSGDYTLELDTGFQANEFTLDDPIKGQLDSTSFVLEGGGVMANITSYVTDISYNRGRQKIDDQFGAGTLTFTMIDLDNILGPYDSDSPYYNPLDNTPGLAPLRKVRLKRENTYLFEGYVTGYDYRFELAGYNTVNVQCADAFYLLAQTQMDELNVVPETSGERIETVLALPEVDYPGTTDIDTGTVNLGHDSAYTVPAGTNTLRYLQQINEAEQGRLFIAADGELVFQPRIGPTVVSPSVDFRDDGLGTKYSDLSVAFDADDVINRAYVKALDGDDAVDTDAASIAKYFVQSVSITNSLLHDQTEVDDLAEYLLNPEPVPRYTSLTTSYSRLTETEKDDVSALDIGDTISIVKTVPGLDPLPAIVAIEGIKGNINVATGHTITFYTSTAAFTAELILNDLLYGKLDFSNVLG